MREDLLKSAESFLSSDSVRSADKKKKTQFLKQKGLTDEEIGEAFKRVGEDNISVKPPQSVQQQTSAGGNAPRLPPRPATVTQFVYYDPIALTPRMSTEQLIRYALITAFSAFGIATAITLIVKKLMSKIFSSIAKYQSNRYQERMQLLHQTDTAVSSFSIDDQLQTEQMKLSSRLDRLVMLTQSLSVNRSKDKSYKGLDLSIECFRNTLTQNPFNSNKFEYHSGFSAVHANRYQAGNDNNTAVLNIKSEIRSFKGMLLSRRNFPVVPPASVKPATVTVLSQAPTSEIMYHPRRRRSFRNEIATTVEEVKDEAFHS